jgi:hypothetical protein
VPPVLAHAQLAKSGLRFLKIILPAFVDENVKTGPMEDFSRQSHIRPVSPHTRIVKTGVGVAHLTDHLLVLDKGPSRNCLRRGMDFYRLSSGRGKFFEIFTPQQFQFKAYLPGLLADERMLRANFPANLVSAD